MGDVVYGVDFLKGRPEPVQPVQLAGNKISQQSLERLAAEVWFAAVNPMGSDVGARRVVPFIEDMKDGA